MLLYRRRIYLIGLVVTFFLLDRLAKDMVQHKLMVSESIPVLPDVFHITYVHNPGAAFSLFHQYPSALLILTSILFLAFLLYSLLKKSLSLQEVFALGLILGGALGNIADRLMLGQVIDYLDFRIIDYPIFNLADAFIFCGICLLSVYYVFQSKRNDIPVSGL